MHSVVWRPRRSPVEPLESTPLHPAGGLQTVSCQREVVRPWAAWIPFSAILKDSRWSSIKIYLNQVKTCNPIKRNSYARALWCCVWQLTIVVTWEPFPLWRFVFVIEGGLSLLHLDERWTIYQRSIGLQSNHRCFFLLSKLMACSNCLLSKEDESEWLVLSFAPWENPKQLLT